MFKKANHWYSRDNNKKSKINKRRYKKRSHIKKRAFSNSETSFGSMISKLNR